MRIGLREANQHFSKVMKAVKAGREIVLTERGKPIATVRPFGRSTPVEEMFRQMEAIGLLRRATKKGPMPLRKPLRIKGPPITKTLREERDLS